jgi:hypothetical protein
MSEAIRSGGAQVSGIISDRGTRQAGREAQEGRAEQWRQLSKGVKKAKRQLQAGYRATGKLYKPFREAGAQGLSDYQSQVAELDATPDFSFDPSQITNNPAYNFRMEQGLEALDRRYAARGGIGGGGRLAGITDYAQGLASTEYENEYRRQYGEYGDKFDRGVTQAGLYGGIAQMGYNATGAQAQNVSNFRGGIADLMMRRAEGIGGIARDQGDIRAATTMGRANNWAATNMYMADQAGQGFDHYVPIAQMGGGGSGGSKKSGGGAGGGA